MTLWLIILRSMRQHALSTIITALSISLAGGLLMSVWTVKDQARATFTGVNGGFDAVLARAARSCSLCSIRFFIWKLRREMCPA